MQSQGRAFSVDSSPAPAGAGLNNIAPAHLPNDILSVIHSAARSAGAPESDQSGTQYLEVFSGICLLTGGMIEEQRAHELKMAVTQNRHEIYMSLTKQAPMALILVIASATCAFLAATGQAQAVAKYLAMFTSVGVGGGSLSLAVRALTQWRAGKGKAF